ncbi:MAG: 50S ribosomal protein L10 [Alphaproteobacteria bacterium]|nr:50S ribosomal protein L10 [Alphaproteobacteria bacterium]
MERSLKKSWVEGLNGEMLKSESVVVARFDALTVAEFEDLRKKAREKNTLVKVTQNRLTKLALRGTKFEGLAPLFTGSTLIAYSEDPIMSHKIVFAFASGNQKLVVLGGASEDKIVDAAGVKDFALLPTLDEARARLLALLKTPIGNMVRALNAKAEKMPEAA